MKGSREERYDAASLRRRHPIAAIVAAAGIDLRPERQALVGRCPFPADGGRPNLYVYPQSDRWHCYRCDIGGDVVDFVRRRENLGFLEACRWLEGFPAQAKVGRTFPRPKPERRWDRLTLEQQIVMNTAYSLYQRALWQEPRAVTHLRKRGLPDRVIHECAVGYCDGQQLSTYLRRHWGLSVAQELGLLRKPGSAINRNETDELLAGRIVVPELRGGQCIWFIGRILSDDTQRPKYLALLAERPISGWARAIARREVFLVEGVLDYLTAIAWYLPAFSPCGTHLPAERLGFLARTRTVYGVLDGDRAGQDAGARFARVLGRRCRPLMLPDGCDLNDLAQRPDGRATFSRLLSAARQTACEEDGHGS